MGMDEEERWGLFRILASEGHFQLTPSGFKTEVSDRGTFMVGNH